MGRDGRRVIGHLEHQAVAAHPDRGERLAPVAVAQLTRQTGPASLEPHAESQLAAGEIERGTPLTRG